MRGLLELEGFDPEAKEEIRHMLNRVDKHLPMPSWFPD